VSHVRGRTWTALRSGAAVDHRSHCDWICPVGESLLRHGAVRQQVRAGLIVLHPAGSTGGT
jgi:hypothetical protein